MSRKLTEELIAFADASPTAFHAVDNAAKELCGLGYTRLQEGERWELKKGGKYFVTRNLSALIGFKIPEGEYPGFQITMSHSDSPAFKLKECFEQEAAGAYLRLDTERYGGPIYSTWLDRPLKISGRVLVKQGDEIVTRLVNLDDRLVIPNLAIHMNPEINKGFVLNLQTDLLPLYGDLTAKGKLMQRLAEKLGAEENQIVGKDLFLNNDVPGMIWGPSEEYYSASRLDDLGCAFTALKGFEAGSSDSVSVYALFDNEEVGSSTKQGAGTSFLYDVLHRIHRNLGRDEEDFFSALSSSFIVSADNAHAIHPNHPEKADAVNRVVLNGGVVVKQTASQSYATDGVSGAIFRTICEKAGVPVQSFANRSDMPGGATIGRIIAGHLALNTVDIGLPQLAMHSCYETAGTKDTEYMTKALTAFYNTSIRVREDGSFRLS